MSLLGRLFSKRPSLASRLRQEIAKVSEIDERIDDRAGALVLRSGSAELVPRILWDERRGELWQTHLHVGVRFGATGFDSCVVGAADTRDQAFDEALENWVCQVGVLFFSFLAARPLGGAEHCDGGDERWGLSGLHGFVGPVCSRGFTKSEGLLEAPLFVTAAELLAPHLHETGIHLLKSNVSRFDDEGWRLTLELDGHGPTTEATVAGDFPDVIGDGMATRFALVVARGS